MGWLWKGAAGEDKRSDGVSDSQNSNPSSEDDDRCSTAKIVKSQCRTEEVEPGKFVRKCVKTVQVLRECVGRLKWV